MVRDCPRTRAESASRPPCPRLIHPQARPAGPAPSARRPAARGRALSAPRRLRRSSGLPAAGVACDQEQRLVPRRRRLMRSASATGCGDLGCVLPKGPAGAAPGRDRDDGAVARAGDGQVGEDARRLADVARPRVRRRGGRRLGRRSIGSQRRERIGPRRAPRRHEARGQRRGRQQEAHDSEDDGVARPDADEKTGGDPPGAGRR